MANIKYGYLKSVLGMIKSNPKILDLQLKSLFTHYIPKKLTLEKVLNYLTQYATSLIQGISGSETFLDRNDNRLSVNSTSLLRNRPTTDSFRYKPKMLSDSKLTYNENVFEEIN